MTQPVYRSTDASAPSLTYANGSLVTVLDAILVNGYGAKPSLGWTKPFSGTNKAVYQQGGGSGFQLRVDDSGANVYEALVRGAESYTDIDTINVGGFPTVAQATNGLFWNKASNVSGTRPWVAWGDSKRFYLFTNVITTADAGWNVLFFGDIASFKAGDSYACMLVGKIATNASAFDTAFPDVNPNIYATSASVDHALARSYTGVGTAVQALKFTDGRLTSGWMGQGSPGSNTLVYPDPVTGSMQLSRVFVYEPLAKSIRGYLPGIWNVCHDAASMGGITNGVTFSGSDGLSGKNFELRKMVNENNNQCMIAVETTDWLESA